MKLTYMILILTSIFLFNCGTTPNSVRSDLGIPSPDLKKFADLNRDVIKHPHDEDVLINFGDQLYATEEYYKAYAKWDYVLKLNPDNSDAQERIDKGIIGLIIEPAEFGENDAEYNSKWNDESFKYKKRDELEKKLVSHLIEKTHLPENVVLTNLISKKWDCQKMTIKKGSKVYKGYAYILAMRMPFFGRRELIRVLKIDENIAKGNYSEAMESIENILKNFSHAKDDANKLKEQLKKSWYKSLRKKKVTMSNYEKTKDEYYAFLKSFKGTKEANKLKEFLEEMLYNYFSSSSIRSMNDAVKMYNDEQKFLAEFSKSKYKPQVIKALENKWSRYLKGSATVIVADPKRARNELFAFRNAFATSNKKLLDEVEGYLENVFKSRYSGVAIADTSDISLMYKIIKQYKTIFPNSKNFFQFESDYQMKIANYIKTMQIADGSQMNLATKIYDDYQKNMPTSPYLVSVKEYLTNKQNELSAEAKKWVDMATEAKLKNQYTLAVRYIEKALEFEPQNVQALDLKKSMQTYMDAISSLNESITKANDASSYSEAISILDAYISKYKQYGNLTKEIKSEKRRLKRWKNRWNRRVKNKFSNEE